MAEPFLAEVKIVSFNFAPKGWAMCNGQLLPINQNQALFSLLGTTYGGLPNLQGRTPMSQGNGYTMGENGGQTQHTLTISELPQHLHFLTFSNQPASTVTPSASVVPAQAGTNSYAPSNNALVTMASTSLSSVGGSQAHTNLQPYLVLNIIIALQGIYPSQN
ncbi:MAG: tail fiber protein [Anaerolineae bacterium]|nr:tail fiber protein [Anaerolineae bacterium]